MLVFVTKLWYKSIMFICFAQEYDPDLPPELAAAAGIHDVPSDNANPGKSEVGQGDLPKGSARVRPPLVCTGSYTYFI